MTEPDVGSHGLGINRSAAQGPLSGIRVIDLTHFLAGPYATLCLAELGASITKVEDPDRPDEARLVGPHFLSGESLYFLSLNWAKESLAVRLSTDRGREALLRLVARADVVLDNFRPGVMDKLGLGPNELRAANPEIVSCSLTGYGATGPYREQPGYDYTIQALSGVMSLTGEPDGPPGKAGISYVDHAAGLTAAMAISAALAGRARGVRGQHIDLSLFDMQISMLTYLAAWELNGGTAPGRSASGAHPSIVPAQTFATRDGYVSVFVGNDEIWRRLVGALSQPELRDDRFADGQGRYRNRGELVAVLESVFSEWSVADLVRVLRDHRVPCAPVNSVSDALEDPQVADRGMVVPVEHPGYGTYRVARGPIGLVPAPTTGAPVLGQDSKAILLDWGFSDAEVDDLIADGVVVQAGESSHTSNRE